MIKFIVKGDYKRTKSFLRRMSKDEIFSQLNQYGLEGVNALATFTPVDTGITASSWNFKVEKSGSDYSITWTNSETAGGTPLVIMLQYGHGTGTGGYVQGRDFINPAMAPIFDKIAENVWKAVTSA